MFYIDPLYSIIVSPALILAIFATILTQSTFSKFSKIRASSGMTGAEAAYRLLEREGIGNVSIEQTNGFLSDHYDPISRKLRLSSKVYNSQSLAAIGVACHEAGHAIQHAKNYLPLYIRSFMVPAVNIGSNASYIILLLGFLFQSATLLMIGICLFTIVVLFSLITLPVEWNASSRAKALMVSAGIVSPSEKAIASKVLNAAFMTYVAAAISALLTLIYYLIRAGLLSARDE
jgi:Zn-dependent membrane protease YugP